MIGHVFADGCLIIAAVPEVVDLVGARNGPLGYRRILRWFALLDRGLRQHPRWATARIDGLPCDIDGCPLKGVRHVRHRQDDGVMIAPASYVEPHMYDHEVDAYQDLLLRANITPSLN